MGCSNPPPPYLGFRNFYTRYDMSLWWTRAGTRSAGASFIPTLRPVLTLSTWVTTVHSADYGHYEPPLHGDVST